MELCFSFLSKVSRKANEKLVCRACEWTGLPRLCRPICPCCGRDSDASKGLKSTRSGGPKSETTFPTFLHNEHSFLGLFSASGVPHLGVLTLGERVFLFVFKVGIFAILAIMLSFLWPESVEHESPLIILFLSVVAGFSKNAYSSVLHRTYFCRVRVQNLEARQLCVESMGDLFIRAHLGASHGRMHDVVLDGSTVSWGHTALVLDVPFRGGILELELLQKSMIPSRQPHAVASGREAFRANVGKVLAAVRFNAKAAASAVRAKIKGRLIGKAFIDMRQLKFGEAKCLELQLKVNADASAGAGVLKVQADLIFMEPIQWKEIMWSGLRPLTENCCLRCCFCPCLVMYCMAKYQRCAVFGKVGGHSEHKFDREHRGFSLPSNVWRWLLHAISLAMLSVSVIWLFREDESRALNVLRVVVESKLMSIIVVEPAALAWEFYSLKMLFPCLLPEYEQDGFVDEEVEEEEGSYNVDNDVSLVQEAPQPMLHQALLVQPPTQQSY